MAAFEEIKGITPELAAKLKASGVASSEGLLDVGKAPKGRGELAKQLGIDGKVVLEWINRADLARVKGIGVIYADLLEEAGVDTIKELATRVPANLHAKINEINAVKKLTTRPPTVEMVQEWIAQAKALPKVVEY
jgi:predicted flap endonuclease-1-like 5' DNA nuclease